MVDFLSQADYMDAMNISQKSRKFSSRNPKSPIKSQVTVPNGGKSATAPKPPNDVNKDEIGGYDGPEPTRFGDWQHDGRCTDF